MKHNYFIYLILLIIWLLASAYMAWQGQYISSYLESRGMLQQEYNYPTDGVLFCIAAYAFVCINYALLFSFEFCIKHPYSSYLLATIVPTLLTALAFLGAMHASSHWGAFIVVMLFTFLLHFLLVPILMGIHRKYVLNQTKINK